MVKSKIYLFARKIHRFFVLITVFLTLLMTATGMLMRNPQWEKFSPIDLDLARYIHNQISLIFTIVLILMTVSGLLMYFYPFFKKAKLLSSSQNHRGETKAADR